MKVKDVNSEKVEKTSIEVTGNTNIPALENFQTCYTLKALTARRKKALLRTEEP